MKTAQMPLRIPSDLHKLLKKSASLSDMSLNQYCLYLFARNVKSEKQLNQEKAEQVLKFLEEAHALQKEMKSPVQLKEIPPEETPLKRWRKLHGKN